MLARIFSVALLVVPVVPQGEGVREEPRSVSEHTAADAFAEASRKLDEASSFLLRYELKSKDFQGTIQVAYRAPDRASLWITLPAGEMRMWIVDGRMSARIRTEDGSSYGDFDVADDDLLRGDLERAISELLPERERSAGDLGPGPFISLDFTSPGENGEELGSRVR